MSRELTKDDQKDIDRGAPKKYPRHPITMENSPEETIRIMQSFPERAAKIRELIRVLRETNSR
jgi:hypothetical protein